MSELPRGTVTFLYTDIEGSTLLLRQLGRDRYDEALNAHHHILESAVAAHEGRVVDTQGDSFFVGFGTAADAIAAAVDAQRELAAHTWPEGKAVKVRMGLHTGEPKVGAERYVGVGVHRAARIGAAGHGGQVLVSQATRELLRDDPMPEISLRDLGEYHLKDIEAPERIFQLAAPGLGETFPPLKTASSTPFEGREDELAEAAAEQMAARWRPPRRRTLILATFGAAVVGVMAGVLLTQGGGSTVSASVQPNSVGVFNPTSGQRTKVIPVGDSPGGVAVGAGATWVTNTDAGTVTRINAGSPTPNNTILVGGGPIGVAVGDDSVWVANGLDGTVSRINAAANRVVGHPIHVGNGPVGIAYDAKRTKVWVANSVDGTVSEIDATSGKVSGPFPAIPGATGVVVAFGRVWVVSPSENAVVPLDPSSGQVDGDKIPVGVDPVAIAAGDRAVWVANRADGTITKIVRRLDHTGVAFTHHVGREPISIAAVKGGVWVGGADGSLTQVDAAAGRPIKDFPLGNPPQALAGTAKDLYVAVRASGSEHRGGTLRVLLTAPGSLDPASPSSTVWSAPILAMTNDGLVGLRRVGGIEGVQLVPDLARALPAPSDNGRTYTFHLRKGVRYSTGKLVQATDVRTTFERALESGGGLGYFGDIVGAAACRVGHACDLRRGIVADDATGTVTFHLTKPDGDFLSKLTLFDADTLPAGTPPSTKHYHPLPATGPYVIKKYDKNHALLVRNPHFRQWSADAQPDGYPKRIVFSFHPFGADDWPNAQLIEDGRADIEPDLGLSPKQLTTLETSYPLQLQVTPDQGTEWFFLNTHVPPFDKRQVRRAVNDAFDRPKYVKQKLGLANAPSCQVLPPDFPGYRLRRCPPAAVRAAKRLVSRAGEAGAKVNVWMPAPGAGQGQFMVSVLKSIGLRAHLKLISLGPKGDISRYFDPISNPKNRVQIGYNQWFADFPSEGAFLPPLFDCKSRNTSQFCDHALDRLFAQAEEAQVRNPGAAPALWQKAERVILAQAPLVPTDSQDNVAFVAKGVGNFQYDPGIGVLLDQLWLK